MKQIVAAKKLNLAIMASGRGSNFASINEAIRRGDLDAEIKILISDKPDAQALEKAKDFNIIAKYINPKDYPNRDAYEEELVKTLKNLDIDLLVLAGYMRLVGSRLLSSFENRVINIHPALLPAFPGLHAQRQALEYGVKYTGCTVHIVDEGMDSGPIIKQVVLPIYLDDTEESLTKRILQEEHQIYWRAIQLFAQGQVYLKGRRVIILEKED
ncbi:MAG TPA: phosphoribosylglycinamide formyltransferase [Syntrophomonadaceae bacterium]|nr:phosphoribosylglycinamide formyltransferase [Syntrophomonadaceae bacterium]